MPKYQYADGKIYSGPVVTMPDGRIKTGATLTSESVRVFEVPDRARDADGGFKADDPSTPTVNEAWEGGVAPKKKAAPKKAAKKKA